MTMYHGERALRRLDDKDLAKIMAGVHDVFKQRHPEMRDIPLPQPKKPRDAQAVTHEIPQPRGLEPIRYAIEIPTVNEEVYQRVREAVEATGRTFVAAIRSVSVGDLLAEDKQREQKGKARRLGFVNDSKTMRATVPPEMEIAINPNMVRIEGSNNLSTDAQKTKIREAEAAWKKQLPEDVRPYVSMRMVDPSTYSQLEDSYMDGTGELLFPNFFARTDAQTVRGGVALVGRDDPTGRRYVLDWSVGNGDGRVFAVPVVVFPRKLVA